jgi:phosphatidylglycerophosphatase A
MRKHSVPKTIWTNPIHFLAFGFGSGAMPIAPGTFGTLAAIPIYFLLRELSLPVYTVILLFIIGIGIWICDVAARDTGVHDHPGIVWDEIAGYLLTMWAAPKGIGWLGLGFIFFRLFDIWKPWPIRWLDRKVQGGLGIMVDDLLAAVYAWLLMHGINSLLPTILE